MKIPFFIPWINDEDKSMVNLALDQRWLTNGKYLKQFETKIKKFVGTNYAVGVSNATQALHLAVKSLGIGPGDEIICPTFTFAATINSILYCGAKPVLVDIQSDTFNIDPKEIQKKITKKTKAIIVVHYGGQSCDMDEILFIGKKYNLHIIEDCAHALGSKYNSKFCGNLGEIGCFSFYPTKIITTAEGGMITTNNKKLANRSTLLRSQAMDVTAVQRETKKAWKYDIIDLGYNYRLDELRSALGISQLKRISQINKMRQNIAKTYTQKIQKVHGIVLPTIKEKRNHIFHLYTIRITKDYLLSRDDLIKKLYDSDIGISVQYTPIHMMSYYKKLLKINKSDFPIANKVKDEILSLPIYPTMTEKQTNYIINKLLTKS